MIRSTTLKHPKVRKAIMRAALAVFKYGYSVDHTVNRNNGAYIAIRKNKNGKLCALDRNGNDISNIVSVALKEEVVRIRNLKKQGKCHENA